MCILFSFNPIQADFLLVIQARGRLTLPTVNISKTIRCTGTKFIKFDCILNSNMCYTLVGMATKFDVIMTLLVFKISDFKNVQEFWLRQPYPLRAVLKPD